MNPQLDIKAIIQEFGPPGYENDNKVLTKLNEIFWAAYYAKSRDKIIFEPCEREFYDYGSGSGNFTTQSSDRVRCDINALMFDAARNWSGFEAVERFRTEKFLNSVIAHLRGHVEERDFFIQPSFLVHLGNCTLEFNPDNSTFNVKPFSPEHRCRNRSPISYDPKARCPEFEKLLFSHLPLEDKILLQKYSGQCILGRNITQRFGILDGVGGASKGAFVLVLAGIVGPKNVYELRTNLLMERFEIGRMLGRTLLCGSDVKGNFLSKEAASRIKSLVGGDPLEAELKGSNKRFNVYGIFNMLITSNVWLRIWLENDRSAWERRIFIVRYDTPFIGKRIFDVHDYLLRKEASGILNWCIEGLKLLFQDYAQAGDIILTPAQKARVDKLLSESDSLRIFVDNSIEKITVPMGNGQHFSLTTQEIIDSYIDDCVNDKHWIPISTDDALKQLPGLMQELFGVTKSNSLSRNGKTKRGFWNVRFK